MIKQKRVRRIISITLFTVYLCVLIYFLFFAENMGRTGGSGYRYNLVPFKEIMRFIRGARNVGTKAVWMNIGGNIAAFVPFGLFIAPVFGRQFSLWQKVLMSLDFAMIVETIQLITRVGSFDVDDLLLNTLGGLLGGLIYMAFSAIERKRNNGKAQE